MSLKQNLIKSDREAESVIKKYNIRTGPVDVEYLAEQLGLEVQYEEFEGELSGVLFRNEEDGEYIIGVNETHPKTRRRFTIAHEIGHFLMHKGKEIHVDRTFKVNFRDATSSQAINIEEMEANAFAAALLMPRDLIFRIIQDELNGEIDLHGDDFEDKLLSDIADKLEVSQQALSIRLGKLGYI